MYGTTVTIEFCLEEHAKTIFLDADSIIIAQHEEEVKLFAVKDGKQKEVEISSLFK